MKKKNQKFKIAIAGTGSVGSRLAVFFTQKNLQVHTLVNFPRKPTRRLITAVKPIYHGSSLSKLSECNVIFLSVPDTTLEQISSDISRIKFNSRHVLLIHTSGSHTSDILCSAKHNRSAAMYLGSMHPMQTFPKKTFYDLKRTDQGLQSAFFGIEGDNRCLIFLKSLLGRLSCSYVVIPAKHKISYHIGGVFANNFLVAMFDTLSRLYSPMGLNKKKTTSILLPLIEETIQYCNNHSLTDILTGPASRNDQRMIEMHLSHLNKLDPLTANAYHALTEICLRLKKEKK